MLNIWRFKNFSGSSDDVNLKRILYFWKNTHWKSTFTTIFNSLYKNNPDYLIWRKTFEVLEFKVKIKNDNDLIQFLQ